jgi:TPP-dependent indolepyruvate ferredoxin oxidoreductase alpha subunit
MAPILITPYNKIMPYDGILKVMVVKVLSNTLTYLPGQQNKYATVTAYKNGSSTSMSIEIPENGVGIYVNTNVQLFEKGDVLETVVDTTNSNGGNIILGVSYEYVKKE